MTWVKAPGRPLADDTLNEGNQIPDVPAWHILDLGSELPPDRSFAIARQLGDARDGERLSGVDFFFLLSGFILATVYGARFSGPLNLREWVRFLVRRAGRLFPLNIAVIAVCVPIAYIAGRVYSPLQIAQELTLIQRWPVVTSNFQAINGPAWSISTEWLANIAFPGFVAITLMPHASMRPGSASQHSWGSRSWKHSTPVASI